MLMTMNEVDDNLILAIVQARMASERLTGKVLMKISGKPVLQLVVERTLQASLIDDIVVATSVNPEDDVIEEFCDEMDYRCFRGDEEDVLDRFHQVALHFEPSAVVRITSDCPLIDPVVIDEVVVVFLESECDYASNTLTRTYPRGLDTEVFTYETLQRAWGEAKLPSEREHVTPYIWKNPTKFRLQNVKDEEDNSNIRLTVDEEEDLELIRRIYDELHTDDEVFIYKDVLELLNKKPHLLDINAGINGNAGYKKSLERDRVAGD